MSLRPENPEAAARLDDELEEVERHVLALEKTTADAHETIARTAPELDRMKHKRDDLCRQAGRSPREILTAKR